MAKNDNGKSKSEIYREERKERLAKVAKKTASKSEKSIRMQKLFQRTIAIVLVAGLVFLIIWKDVLPFTGVTQIMTNTMTIGSDKISARDFNYYYVLMYNYTSSQSKQYQEQYGQNVMGFDSTISPADQDYPQKNEDGTTITWAQYLSNSAIERAQQYEVLYKEALSLDKAKYTLTDEETTTLNGQIESIRSTAAKQNMSINSYLREFYGNGISEKFLKAQLEKETIVARFSEDKLAEFKAAWTDDKVKAEYDADKNAYDVVNLRIFSFTTEALTANKGETSDALAERQKTANAAVKAKAEAMLAKVTDDASFISQASANTKPVEGQTYDADSATANFYKSKDKVESSISTDAATWAFADGRVAGDKSVFQSDTGDAFVVWVKTPQFPPITVDVRHILISFKADTSDTTAATTKEIADAKLKADNIYAEWQAGDKTEDSFAVLANNDTTDPGNTNSDGTKNGGLYEDVAPGSMVPPFENWCFDPGKKPGDTGIVQSTYGYHIMYMVNNDAANFAYIATIRDDKAAADNEAFVTALLADEKYTLTKNEKNITLAEVNALKIIEKMIALNNSNSSKTSA